MTHDGVAHASPLDTVALTVAHCSLVAVVTMPVLSSIVVPLMHRGCRGDGFYIGDFTMGTIWRYTAGGKDRAVVVSQLARWKPADMLSLRFPARWHCSSSLHLHEQEH